MLTQPQQQQPRGQQRLRAGETQGCHRRARPSPSADWMSAPGPVDARSVGSWQRSPPTVRTRCPHEGRGVPTGNASSPRAAAGSCGVHRRVQSSCQLAARTHIRQENLAFNHFFNAQGCRWLLKGPVTPSGAHPQILDMKEEASPSAGHSKPQRTVPPLLLWGNRSAEAGELPRGGGGCTPRRGPPSHPHVSRSDLTGDVQRAADRRREASLVPQPCPAFLLWFGNRGSLLPQRPTLATKTFRANGLLAAAWGGRGSVRTNSREVTKSTRRG